MLVVSRSRLKEVLALLQKEYAVFVPAKEQEVSAFIPFDPDREIELEENVQLSPKKIYFPQTEEIYRFKTVRNTVEFENIQVDSQKTLIFGVRACDLKSLSCLDQVFLTRGFTDSSYQEKRQQTVTVALACNRPGEACFCTSMEVDPQKAENADIQAYLSGEKMGFEALSRQGKEVLDLLAGQLSVEELEVPGCGSFKIKFNGEGVPEKLKTMFESEIWDEIARKCVNCGACTYLCPTCHCFDINQEVRGEDGVKYRCWDSCMFGDYTQMAGGHNPRPGKKERVRNRFMHKLCFFPERYNMLLCTGCGRCLENCPVQMDITSVIKRVQEVG